MNNYCSVSRDVFIVKRCPQFHNEILWQRRLNKRTWHDYNTDHVLTMCRPTNMEMLHICETLQIIPVITNIFHNESNWDKVGNVGSSTKIRNHIKLKIKRLNGNVKSTDISRWRKCSSNDFSLVLTPLLETQCEFKAVKKSLELE